MKIQRENGISRGARLNKIVFVVALLWLVTSVLVIFLYRPGAAHAVQPPANPQQVALVLPHAARASTMY
jgi:preprotein translocase subunit SecG